MPFPNLYRCNKVLVYQKKKKMESSKEILWAALFSLWLSTQF